MITWLYLILILLRTNRRTHYDSWLKERACQIFYTPGSVWQIVLVIKICTWYRLVYTKIHSTVNMTSRFDCLSYPQLINREIFHRDITKERNRIRIGLFLWRFYSGWLSRGSTLSLAGEHTAIVVFHDDWAQSSHNWNHQCCIAPCRII